MGRTSVCVGLAALACVAAPACFDPHPQPGQPCAPGGLCPDPLWCDRGICVAGDAGGGMIDACPPVSCTGDELVDCTGSHRCAHGCATEGPPHCLALVPSNGISTSLLAGATADVGNAAMFDTDSGEITVTGGMTLRAAGTGVIAGIGFSVVDGMGVFTAASFSVPPGATWTASGDNALVLFAAGSISVDGTIDAGGLDIDGGPGGGDGGVGGPTAACGGGDGRWKASISAGAGGGGGGGATAGGDGAATMPDGMGATAGGAGGASCAVPSAIPLRGGNGGGAGGTENMLIRGGPGGGGGGAVALVAMTRVTVTGAVGAPGEGGACDPGGSGGGGAGSGGVVFVEAPDVVVSGALTANGGGGGAPENDGVARVRGERGHLLDATPAQGAIFNGRAGGHGGAGMVGPTNGETDVGGAGGGGAVGKVTMKSISNSLAGATISPGIAASAATLE
jgi:hypothetical protein